MRDASKGGPAQTTEHDAKQSEAEPQMQVPHKRWLTPMVAPPSMGLGAGSWRWLTPRDIIPTLPAEHALYLELASWVNLVTMEGGEKAVDISTAPGTRRCVWLGWEAEQSHNRSAQAADDPEQEDEEEFDGSNDEDSDEPPAPTGNISVMTVTATPAKEGAGDVSKTTRKKPVPHHVGDYPWLRCFAPGHPMAQTEAPYDAQVVLVFLKTRGLFEARFSTPTFPRNVPAGLRLKQATRTCKVVGEVTEHEAFRQVLLWIWQKFCGRETKCWLVARPCGYVAWGAEAVQASAVQGLRRWYLPSHGRRGTFGPDVDA